MKCCSLRSVWRIIFLFVIILTGGFQSVEAVTDTTSVDSLQRQIKMLVQDKLYSQAAKAYDSLGKLYHRQYGYNKYTMDSYLSSLKYYSLMGDSLGYFNQYLVIGDYYTQDYFMHAYAEQYLKKAQQYFERTHNMPKVIESRLGLHNIAQHVEPMPPGLKTHLRETERLSVQYKQPYSQAYALSLLANTYLLSKQPDSAYYFASRSLIISNRLNVNWLIGLNHFYLGLVEQFRHHSLAAIEAYQKSYNLSKAENSLGMMRELSRHTADSYSRMGDYKNAYDWSSKTLDYTVQFYASEQTKSIRLQELDSQIKTLAVEKQLVEEKSRNQNVLNSALFIGFIISIIGVFTLAYLRRQQKLIDHQHTVIAQQQIRQLELKSLRAMIEGQEGERSRIARDLHDGLGIQLSRIKLFIEAHQEELPLSVKEPLNQFLDEACTETRLISNDLRPYALSTFGLVPALEDLVQKLNLVNKTKLILDHYGEMPPLGDEAAVMIYRVVQELLNNALKHAHAQMVTVQLMVNEETTLISVDDDGQGADFDNLQSKGNGISNIQSRIAYLGGQVMWHGEAGKGTSVMISLPMQKLQKLEAFVA
ncbi:sensor histidine kinase [Dyadobacter chenwenxiniae]|uniref:histidine kinase n=1 Tax=Dyadobacter chenwenxiniae TaxID=2906456 RepID=A0A9X1PRU3_9BACT|nr:sensor histidine kinase [Dyadobacter chenwenxiniae]MCF0065761.1 sensor histidine kinase [Dyadobacter chenwenxiniae]UON84133.1 sensor histidine kinase [Dyadobacter chenwenxiniae]